MERDELVRCRLPCRYEPAVYAGDWVSWGRSCSFEAIDPLRAARGADLACRGFSCSRAHPFEGCRVDAWEVEAKYGRRRFFAPPSVRCEWLATVTRVQRRRLPPWPPLLLSLRHPRTRDAGLGRRSRGWSATSWVIGREPARLWRSIRFSFSGRERGADLALRGPAVLVDRLDDEELEARLVDEFLDDSVGTTTRTRIRRVSLTWRVSPTLAGCSRLTSPTSVPSLSRRVCRNVIGVGGCCPR